MDYNKQQLLNECNSLIDEYIETRQMDATRLGVLLVHYIRSTVTDEERKLHQSEQPIKRLFS